MTEIKPNYIKIMLFFKKLPEISDEQFHDYWINVHGAGERKTIFAEKVKRSTKIHFTPELKATAKELNMGKIGVLDFDGLAELYFESVQDWNDLISDEEFRKFTAEDGPKFSSGDPIMMMMGYENLWIGKPTGMETQVKGKLVDESGQ